VRWGVNQWLITDTFRREWRFWIPPIGERLQEARVSRWDMVGEPLFHLVPQAFSECGAREDEAAGDLLAIYDSLTGSRLCDDLPRPTVDRRRRLRGFDRELSRVLYAALEAGVLKFERHEVPWPFPEKDDAPDDRKGPSNENEKPTDFLLTVQDEAGVPVDGVDVTFSWNGEQRTMPTDAAGKARLMQVKASHASVRFANMATVREKVEPRWDNFRKRKVPTDPHVAVLELRDDMQALELEPVVANILVLAPLRYFKWVASPAALDKEFLIQHGGGGEIQRVPVGRICTEAGDCETFDIDDALSTQFLDIELFRDERYRYFPVRVHADRLRAAFRAQNLKQAKDAFQPILKESDPVAELEKGESLPYEAGSLDDDPPFESE